MGQVSANHVLCRREVVRTLLADRNDVLVVTGLGSASYDVMAAGDHDNNYYLWAAMGSAITVGLGLANAQPDKSVVVVTGDNQATAEAVCRSIGALGQDAGLDSQQLSSLSGVWGHCLVLVSGPGVGACRPTTAR